MGKTLVLNQGQFCPPGDVWQSLDTFLVVMIVCGGVGATVTYWLEARDAAKHPTVHRTGPQ